MRKRDSSYAGENCMNQRTSSTLPGMETIAWCHLSVISAYLEN
jgi:hypothetical protein